MIGHVWNKAAPSFWLLAAVTDGRCGWEIDLLITRYISHAVSMLVPY